MPESTRHPRNRNEIRRPRSRSPPRNNPPVGIKRERGAEESQGSAQRIKHEEGAMGVQVKREQGAAPVKVESEVTNHSSQFRHPLSLGRGAGVSEAAVEAPGRSTSSKVKKETQTEGRRPGAGAFSTPRPAADQSGSTGRAVVDLTADKPVKLEPVPLVWGSSTSLGTSAASARAPVAPMAPPPTVKSEAPTLSSAAKAERAKAKKLRMQAEKELRARNAEEQCQRREKKLQTRIATAAASATAAVPPVSGALPLPQAIRPPPTGPTLERAVVLFPTGAPGPPANFTPENRRNFFRQQVRYADNDRLASLYPGVPPRVSSVVDRLQLGTLVAVYDENGTLSRFAGRPTMVPLSNAERDDILKYFGEEKLVELESTNRRFNHVQTTGFPPAGCRTAPALVPGAPATKQPAFDMLVKDEAERKEISDRFDDADPEQACFQEHPVKRGYVFVKKGNAYITKLIKKLAREANKTVYIVFSGSSTTRGIQVPADIRAKAEEHEKSTREDSGHNRGLREARIRKEYRVCLDAMFSKIPSSDADKIVILCRESDDKTLPLPERLRLATKTHIQRLTLADFQARKRENPHMPGTERDALYSRMKQDDGKIWNDWGPFNVDGNVQCSNPRRITRNSRIHAHENHFIYIAKRIREEERLRGEAFVVDDDSEEGPFVVNDDDEEPFVVDDDVEERPFVVDDDDEEPFVVNDSDDENEHVSSHVDSDDPPMVHEGDSSEDEVTAIVKEEAGRVKEEEMDDAMSEILDDTMSEILDDAMSEILDDVKAESPDRMKLEDSEDDMKPLAHPALRKRKSPSPLPMRPRKGRLVGVAVIHIDD